MSSSSSPASLPGGLKGSPTWADAGGSSVADSEGVEAKNEAASLVLAAGVAVVAKRAAAIGRAVDGAASAVETNDSTTIGPSDGGAIIVGVTKAQG